MGGGFPIVKYRIHNVARIRCGLRQDTLAVFGHFLQINNGEQQRKKRIELVTRNKLFYIRIRQMATPARRQPGKFCRLALELVILFLIHNFSAQADSAYICY